MFLMPGFRQDGECGRIQVAAVCGLVFVIAMIFAGCVVPPNVQEGGACEKAEQCAGYLTCIRGRCAVDLKKEQEMAKQSGVSIPTERAPDYGAAPGAVKIRSASGKNYAVATCDKNERLIGGWCLPAGRNVVDHKYLTRQQAIDYSANDTIGARWQCVLDLGNSAGFDVMMKAFAMCQRVAEGAQGEPTARDGSQ